MSTAKFASTIVGNLACQNNSYLKSLKTTVISCSPITTTSAKDGKPSNSEKEDATPAATYEVELDDTILFPEGGGQPSDLGAIIDAKGNRFAVSHVRRDGLIAKHCVQTPIPVGDKVELELDWGTRLDHMQQHTGQHLLSAVLEKLYNLKTLSWKMASAEQLVNYLDIPRKLSAMEIEAINEECSLKINENLPITVNLPPAFENENGAVKTTKIPKDYDLEKGVLRVIHIGGDSKNAYDVNPCCGTHLKSTLEINIITVLKNQQNVHGGFSRIFFLCGNSRNNKFSSYNYSILKECMASLSCQADEVNSKSKALTAQSKKNLNTIRHLTEELAAFEVEKIERQYINKLDSGEGEEEDFNNIIFKQYPDKSFDFINFISRSLANKFFKEISDSNNKVFLVLLAGDFAPDNNGNQGALMIVGSAKSGDLGKRLVADKIFQNLKGGGAKSKWQGKISSFQKGEVQSFKQWLSQNH